MLPAGWGRRRHGGGRAASICPATTEASEGPGLVYATMIAGGAVGSIAALGQRRMQRRSLPLARQAPRRRGHLRRGQGGPAISFPATIEASEGPGLVYTMMVAGRALSGVAALGLRGLRRGGGLPLARWARWRRAPLHPEILQGPAAFGSPGCPGFHSGRESPLVSQPRPGGAGGPGLFAGEDDALSKHGQSEKCVLHGGPSALLEVQGKEAALGERLLGAESTQQVKEAGYGHLPEPVALPVMLSRVLPLAALTAASHVVAGQVETLGCAQSSPGQSQHGS